LAKRLGERGPFRAQLDHSRYRLRHWLPSGYGSDVSTRLRIVSDAREETTQLNGGGQFALPLEDGADGGGNGFSNKEHGQKDGAAPSTRQAILLLRGRAHRTGTDFLRKRPAPLRSAEE
jgi:hypothetical protein